MTKPRVILFDIGETLWSSPPEDPAALQECYGRGRAILVDAMGEASVPAIEALIEVVEGHFAEWEIAWRNDPTLVTQRPTHAFVADALAHLELLPPQEALEGFTDALLETSIYTAIAEKPEPDMIEAMEALSSLDVRLGCVSNAFMTGRDLMRILDAKGLAKYLEDTIASCEAGYRKPHPGIYQAGLDMMGATAEEAIFVGDRLYADVEGPGKLGMRTVLTTQYRKEDHSTSSIAPDLVIAHLRELAPWVESLLKSE